MSWMMADDEGLVMCLYEDGYNEVFFYMYYYAPIPQSPGYRYENLDHLR